MTKPITTEIRKRAMKLRRKRFLPTDIYLGIDEFCAFREECRPALLYLFNLTPPQFEGMVLHERRDPGISVVIDGERL